MLITLQDVGKRFERNWVFRNISLEFKPGKKYAILGPNGSGKSTLLKAISGSLTLSEGKIEYTVNGSAISVEGIYKHLSIVAPYLDIPEEYTLEELIEFHKTFKQINLPVDEIITRIELTKATERTFKHFSSGMKQRVKLGLAIMSDTPLLLLDEPTTALDANAVQWYQGMINEHALNKTILVFSNNKEEEFKFCEEILSPLGLSK
jgi:ABC-type multidrug transport system ATPase subunit